MASEFNIFYKKISQDMGILNEYNKISLDLPTIPASQLMQHLEGIFEDPSNELNNITNIQQFERETLSNPEFLRFVRQNGYSLDKIKHWFKSKYEGIQTPEVVMTNQGLSPGSEVSSSFI